MTAPTLLRIVTERSGLDVTAQEAGEGSWVGYASCTAHPAPLASPLEDWIKVWNDNARPCESTGNADQILDRICRHCDRTSGPGH
ncbi:hypothetical protein GCM10010433_68880 [Streptomyces pulveraceus]|uniref:Uncharacterized protein n=1 Tax=Streptomyces pulveraceus TaxID=68258 RepID=A0ABW1GL05_9ACTN